MSVTFTIKADAVRFAKPRDELYARLRVKSQPRTETLVPGEELFDVTIGGGVNPIDVFEILRPYMEFIQLRLSVDEREAIALLMAVQDYPTHSENEWQIEHLKKKKVRLTNGALVLVAIFSPEGPTSLQVVSK